MSYLNGMSALNLEMPDVIPRTEYSASTHWSLVKAVTGISVDEHSAPEFMQKASSAFVKEWDYGMYWNIVLKNQEFNGFFTKMGHASYASGGVDYSSDVSCPFDDPEDVLKFDPLTKYGIPDKSQAIKMFEDDYKEMCTNYTDTVNMTGIYVSCMSGLIEILGWEMLLSAAGIDPDGFGALTDRYVNWVKHYFEALADSNVPVVMIHDDIVWTGGPFISPEWYRKYLFTGYKKLFTPLIESGKKIIYTSDGNFTEFIDDVVGCGVHGLVMEPLTDMTYIAEKYGKTHAFVGNVDTRVLLQGTRDDIYSEVKRCIDIGKDCPGFFLAVGNHIPSNTPYDNAMYYNECYQKLSKR